MKKLFLSVFFAILSVGLQNSITAVGEDISDEEKLEKQEEQQAKEAEKAAEKVKERTIGERIFNLASPIVACECAHGNRVTHDCSKLCTGVLRNGWKGKAIELTNKGFTCVCDRKNYGVSCTSSFYPKACGKLGKPWSGKVSFVTKKGQGRIFDTKTQKTEVNTCPLPEK